MKFLCVSDQIDPLVYSTSARERYSDIDGVFCAGDLSLEYVDYIVTALGKPTYFIFGNHDLKDFKYYNKRNYSVAGKFFSWNEIEDMDHGHGGDYAGNVVIRDKKLGFSDRKGKKNPLLICGVSGSRKYNNGQAQYTEAQMKRQLIALIPQLLINKLLYGRYCDVFLTHASPRHIHDREDPCHMGFDCFNWFIDRFHPALMIHGHIHLYDLSTKRVTVKDETTIVNAFSRVVIDIKPEYKGEKLGFNISVLTDR